jgi:N-acetylmuramoyl-L-alanine amidase
MKVFIDPGHGGDDNGAAWGYAEEDDINLSIALLLRPVLIDHRFKVMLSRQRDVAISLYHRCWLAHKWGADLFVSIHCDAFHNTTISGMSVHIYEKTLVSEPLGEAIAQALMDKFPDHKQRGVQQSNFYVLRESHCPACLIECEFLSNPETRQWLREPENQLALAEAIGLGLRNYADLAAG